MCVASQHIALICMTQNQSPFSKANICAKVFFAYNSIENLVTYQERAQEFERGAQFTAARFAPKIK